MKSNTTHIKTGLGKKMKVSLMDTLPCIKLKSRPDDQYRPNSRDLHPLFWKGTGIIIKSSQWHLAFKKLAQCLPSHFFITWGNVLISHCSFSSRCVLTFFLLLINGKEQKAIIFAPSVYFFLWFHFFHVQIFFARFTNSAFFIALPFHNTYTRFN